MKAIFTSKELICCLLILWFQNIVETAAAQVAYAVGGITTTATSSTVSTSYTNIAAASGTLSSGLTNTYNFTYGLATQATNNNVQMTGFTANSLVFTYSAQLPTVSFRRVDINNAPSNVVVGKRVNLWFERAAANSTLSTATSGTGNGGTAQLIPDYTDVLETLFATRTYNIGIDNVFQNTNATDNNNIERVDVVFPSGLQAINAANVGFAVFDRGPDGQNDPFMIAAIKKVDGSGNPLDYYPPVNIVPGLYGTSATTTGGTAINYHILRKEATETTLKMMNPNQGGQNRNGVFLTFTQLGVPAATTTYGYSVFSTDVTYTATTDLASFTNATYFPNNTNYPTTGGLDMLAVAGVAYTSTSEIVILPVQVSYFNAIRTGNQVQLSWQLDATDDLAETVLERSANGTDFTPLLYFYPPFSGQQTASDSQPLPGNNYYRLKMANKDGAVAGYSQVNIVTIDQSVPVVLHMYPNPVKNKHFRLDAQGLNNETYDLRVFDMSGNLVLHQSLTGAPVFSMNVALPPGLPVGAYTVQLKDGNGRKVVVNALMVE